MLRYFFFLLLYIYIANANFSALLLGVDNDYLFHFSHKDRAFYCRPAAVTTIDQLLLTPQIKPICKNRAQTFIRKYPYTNKQYAYKLHKEQKYYLIGLKQECFVMLNAGTSFSEYLLEEGFAKLQNRLEDSFLNSSMYKKLKKSQDRAEYYKKGIWEDPVLANCF